MQTNSSYEILNISIAKISPSHLFEKQPIVIQEPLVQPMDLCSSLFNYLYIKKKHIKKTISNVYMQNRSKYLIIYPRENNLSLNLVHPKQSLFLKHMTKESLKYVEYVEFKLKKRQCLIIPMYWWYSTNSENFGKIELEDVLSFLFGKF